MARPVRSLTIVALVLGLAALAVGAVGAHASPGALGQPDPLSFGAAQNVALGHYTGAMIAGKFNGGPRADLAISNNTPAHARSGTLTIVRDADGHFHLVRTVAVRPFTGPIATADLNGDGKLDLVVGTPSSMVHSAPSLSVLLGVGNGTFRSPHVFDLGHDPGTLVLADVNGDHRVDVLIASDKWIVVLLGRGDGTLGPRHSYLIDAALRHGDGRVGSFAVSDVNGDGKPDVVVGGVRGVNVPTGTINVLLGNGRGAFGAAATTTTGELLPGGLAIADLNRDGKRDLVVNDMDDTPDYGGGPEVAVIAVSLGNGDGTFTQTHKYDLSELGSGALSLRDMDGDGIRDAVVVLNSGFDVLQGDGAGGFEAPVAFAHTHWTGDANLAVADYNGDGKLDVAVNDLKTLSVFLNTTTTPVP